jgi:3-phytase
MRARLWPSVLLGVVVAAGVALGQGVTVAPRVQTGDLATGPLLPVIWENPLDPSASRVYTVDGSGDVLQYLLNGTTDASASLGARDLAVAYNVPFGGEVRDLLVVGTDANVLSFFAIDSNTGALTVAGPDLPVLAGSASTLDRVAVYQSPLSEQFYAFVADQTGNVEQWQFFADSSGAITASVVDSRGIGIGERLGGWVVDEADMRVYVTGRSQGLYRFDAEPGGDGLALVDSTSGAGDLVPPVGGVALYRAHGQGYLVVANTGSSDFALYNRGPSTSNDFVTRFQIGAGNGLDGVQGPIGLSVMSFGLGTAFPKGLLVAEDGFSSSGQTDLKYVAWSDLATAASLATPDATDNPHGTLEGTDGGTPDGGTGGGSGGGAGGGIPAGGGAGPTPHSGCNAASTTLGGMGFLALLFLVLRRRRGVPRLG